MNGRVTPTEEELLYRIKFLAWFVSDHLHINRWSGWDRGCILRGNPDIDIIYFHFFAASFSFTRSTFTIAEYREKMGLVLCENKFAVFIAEVQDGDGERGRSLRLVGREWSISFQFWRRTNNSERHFGGAGGSCGLS